MVGLKNEQFELHAVEHEYLKNSVVVNFSNSKRATDLHRSESRMFPWHVNYHSLTFNFQHMPPRRVDFNCSLIAHSNVITPHRTMRPIDPARGDASQAADDRNTYWRYRGDGPPSLD